MNKASPIRHAVLALGVLLLGLAAGYRGLGPDWAARSAEQGGAGATPSAALEAPSSPPRPRVAKLAEFSSAHAEAWDSLKDRNLPHAERRALQMQLLSQWAESDLEAAIHAALTETDIEDFLSACNAAVLAKPMEAWELARSKAFGWESARVRHHCLEALGKNDPSRLFGLFDQMTRSERLGSVSSAMSFTVDKTPMPGDGVDMSVVRETALFKQILALESRTDAIDLLREAGSQLHLYFDIEELAALRESAQSAAEKRLLLSAHATRQLGELDVGDVCPPRGLDDRETSRGLDGFPADLRTEMAAIALRYGWTSSDFILEFAKVAVEAGDLDSLKVASDAQAFIPSSQSLRSPGLWADWALALPDDPRTIDTFGQVMLGAAFCDLEGTAPKIEALSPSRRRDLGYAALVYGTRGHEFYEEPDPEGEDEEEVDEAKKEAREREFEIRRERKIAALLEQISDPVLRDEADKFYRP